MAVLDVIASTYRDRGCNLYASCLRCPLPACRYDEPIPLGRQADLRAEQAATRAAIRRDLDAKMTWSEIQAKYNCSRGLINKARAEGRDAATG